MWQLGVGMLTGWVVLDLFLLAVLRAGGTVQIWHGVVWVTATFFGMWIVTGGQRTEDGGRAEGAGIRIMMKMKEVLGLRTEGLGTKSLVGGGRQAEDGGRAEGAGMRIRMKMKEVLGLRTEGLGTKSLVGGGRWVEAGVLTGIGLALPILLSWVMGHFTDMSWDGMTSRGITVRNLMIGQPALNELSLGHVTGGFLAKLSDNWQAGKGINLTLLWISLCYALGGLRDLGFQRWRLVTLACLAALNPVVIYQISCFQIDGHVASLFTCLAFAALGVWSGSTGHLSGWLGLFAAFFSLSLAKNSGIFYAITILIVLAGFLICSRDLQPRLKKIFIFSLLAFLVVGLMAQQFAGLGQLNSDRLKLVADIRTPGFGVGDGASKVREYLQMSRPTIFAASAFAMTEVIPEEIRLKLPFAMTRRELRVFEELTPDPRAGGFGPQFSGAMLLAGIGCCALLLWRQPIYFPGLFLVLAAVLSSYFSQLWWARWTPQNWLILIGMLMTLVHAGWNGEAVWRGQGAHVLRAQAFTRWIQAVTVLAITATAFNVALVTTYYGVGMVRQENVLNRQIKLAKNLGELVPIYLPPNHDGSHFLASELWFTEHGLQVRRLDAEPGRPRMKINKTNTRFPLPQDWRHYLKDPKDEALFRKRGCVED